jgi:hypothetical protein
VCTAVDLTLHARAAVAQQGPQKRPPLSRRSLRRSCRRFARCPGKPHTGSRQLFLYIFGSVIAGAGFGAGFAGGLRALVAVIPHEHRASTMAAFYIVAYASLSLPAVLAGAVIGTVGLSSTFEIFASTVAGIALVVAGAAALTRPQ